MSDDNLTLESGIAIRAQHYEADNRWFRLYWPDGVGSIILNIDEIDAIHKFAHEQNDKEKNDVR